MSDIESIDISVLADAVASRLAVGHSMRQEHAVDAGRLPHPVPEQHGKIIPLDPKSRGSRVRFDEDELELAVSSRGMGCALRKVAGAPVEVKLVMALLLGIGLDFSDVDDSGAKRRSGFDNPLVVDSRIGAIASHFGVSADRLELEVANAPGEMLAVLLAVADLCLAAPAPVADAVADDIERGLVA